VVEELLSEGEQVVAIERTAENTFIATARRLGAAVIIGSATVPEVLRQANVAGARAVVAATDNDLGNLEIAMLVRDLNANQRVVVRVAEPQLAQTLREAANVRLAFSIPELAAPAFVGALFGDRVRSVCLVADRLLAVVDLVVQAGDGFLDGAAVRELAADYQLLPLSLQRADKTMPADLAEARLGAGDCLTVVVALPDLQRLLKGEDVAARRSKDVPSAKPD